MGLFSKFKRHPPRVADDYFAQFSEDAIDLNSDMFTDVLQKAPSLKETWPYVSLSDLNRLIRALKNDFAVPTSRVIELGTVTYLQNDEQTGEAVETGLTWQNAKVTADSDNFVVETVRETLNDPDTRQDDDVSYDQIRDVFLDLLNAAEKYVPLDMNELPNLPDEDEFIQAVQQNQPLVIEEIQYWNADEQKSGSDSEILQPDKPSDSYQTDSNVVEPEHHNVESKASSSVIFEGPEVASNSELEVQSSLLDGLGEPPLEPMEDTNTEIREQTPDISANTPEVSFDGQSSESVPVVTRLGRHQVLTNAELLDELAFDYPTFTIDPALVDASLNASDSKYVVSEMEKEKREANIYLKQSADEFVFEIKAKLKDLIDDTDFQKQRDQLIDADWQDDMKAEVAAQVDAQFKQTVDQRLKQINQSNQQAVTAENQRHADALQALENQQAEQLSEAKAELNTQKAQLTTTQQTAKIQETQAYLNQQLSALQTKHDRKVSELLIDANATFVSDATNSLQAGFKAIKDYLKKREAELQSAHDAAVKVETANIDAKLSAEEFSKQTQAADEATRLVEQLKEQLQKSEGEREVLDTQLQKTANEASALTAQVKELKNAAEHTESNELLKTVIASGYRQQSQEPQEPQQIQIPEKKNYWKYSSIGILALIGVVSIGASGYTVMHQNQHQLAKQESIIQKQDAQLKSTQNKSRNQSSHKSEIDSAHFNILDESLDSGSLSVYERSFKDQNLGTEDRTLKTGKLLIQNGQKDDAWVLAEKNNGHNESLLKLLEE
ncbi:hypothetical protein JK159_02275 [Weissella minor]|uniref:hypothetical protein n=1 Tax=Weissella minor TaxID=1620 RepID=UPI001BAE7FFF|nr:hypothetical protein [Weissella minor]MBS0949209.1 hypothetical protein [Weissella minor]